MTLSEMRQILAGRDIKLTKSLGQNFLHDGNQLRRIVAAAELSPQDRVLEIGPGLGPLTELLIKQAGEVLAIEKDGRLVEVLRTRFDLGRTADSQFGIVESSASNPRCAFQLIHDDALDYLKRQPCDWSAWKLVANLPYSVASPILVELAQCPRRPERLVATLQFEVARRIVAQAGDADYGLLALLLQLHYEPRGLFKIPAACFFPPPDVDSACITLVRRERELLPEKARQAFVKIVKRAFSQRRKMMMKLLKVDWPVKTLEAAFAELQISPQARAEAVGLHQFVQLAQCLPTKS
jgi:16S rRNA (adenine1518-N6/adenine1519-N6)-dimethyltransferase